MFNILDNVRKIANDAHANVVEMAQTIAAGLQEEDEPGVSGEDHQNDTANNSLQKVKSGASRVIETIDKAAKLLTPTTDDVVFIDLLAKLMRNRTENDPQVRNWLKLYDEWQKDDNFDKFEQLRHLSESLTSQKEIFVDKGSSYSEVEQKLNDIDLSDDGLKDARARIAELEEQVQQLAEENDTLMSHQIAANVKNGPNLEKEVLKLSEDLDLIHKEAADYKEELVIKRQALEFSVQQEKALNAKVIELTNEIERIQSEKNSIQSNVEQQLNDIESNYQETVTANNKLQEQLKNADDRISELESQTETLIEEKSNLSSQLVPDNSEALKDIQDENAKLSEDLGFVRKEVSEYKEELIAKQQALEQHIQEEGTLKSKILELTNEIEKLQSDKNSIQSEMEQQLRNIESRYQEAATMNNELQEQLKNTHNRIAELEGETQTLIEEKKTFTSLQAADNSEALQNIQDENLKLSEDLEHMKKEVTKYREEFSVKERELKQSLQQEEALKTKIAELVSEVERIQSEENLIQSNTEQELRDITSNYQEAITNNDKLEDQLKEAQNKIASFEVQTRKLIEEKDTLLSKQVPDNSELLKNIQDENIRLSETLDHVQKELSRYKEEFSTKEQELEQSLQQEEALKSKIMELVNEIEKVQSEKSLIQSNVEQQLKDLESTYQEAVTTNNQLQNELKETHNRSSELEVQVRALTEEKNVLISQQIPDNSEFLKNIQDENIRLSEDLDRMQKEVILYKEELLVNKQKLEHFVQQEEVLNKKVIELTNEVEKTHLDKNSIQSDVEQQLKNIESNYQEVVTTNNQLQAQLREAYNKITELETYTRALVEEKNALIAQQVPDNSEALQSIQNENFKLSEELGRMQKEAIQYKEELLVNKQKLEHSVQQEEALKMKLLELTNALQRTELDKTSAIEGESRRLKDMEVSLQQLQRENETLKRDLHLAHADSYSSKEMTQKLQHHIEMLKKELTAKEVEIAEIAAELSTNEHDRHKLGTESSADIEQLRKLLDSADKEISFITSKNEDLRRNLQQVTNQLTSEKTVVSKLSSEKDVLSMQLQNLKEDHAQLKADFERLNNSDRSKSSAEVSEIQNKFSQLEISMNMVKQALKQIYADEREQRQTFSLLLSILGFDQQMAETMVHNFESHSANNTLQQSGPGLIEQFDKFVEKEIAVNKIQLSPAPQKPFAMTIDEPLEAPEESEQGDLKDII